MNIIKDLKKIKCGKILENVELKKYNTYKVESTVLAMVFPENREELIELLKYIKQNNISSKVIGNGSNLVFTKKHYDMVFINLSNFNNCIIEDTTVNVECGYSMVKLAMQTARLGLTGFEFASGIPGTVGGAIYMNAGAYKSDMGYVVSEVEVITPSLEIKTMYNKELNFHYRTSFFHENKDYICLSAKIILKKGNKEAIMAVNEDRKKRRLMSQPLEYPSAGSVFRNPENMFAGKLIEDLGLKGYIKNGVEVSEKHANFIINRNNANGEDIKNLIEEIKNKVYKEYQIELKVEQEFV